MQVTLVMFKSDGTRRDIPLQKRRSVIGRMHTCDLRIPLTSISREHCEVVWDDAGVSFKDLNSSNGVYHNGAKARQGRLKPGDELVVGPVLFTVVVNGQPRDIRPVRTILDERDDRKVDADMPAVAAAGMSDDDLVPTVEVLDEVETDVPFAQATLPDTDAEETLITPSPADAETTTISLREEPVSAPSSAPSPALAPARAAKPESAKPQAAKPQAAEPEKEDDEPAMELDDFEFTDELGSDQDEPVFDFDDEDGR